MTLVARVPVVSPLGREQSGPPGRCTRDKTQLKVKCGQFTETRLARLQFLHNNTTFVIIVK